MLYLLGQFFCQDVFRVQYVQMREIYEDLSHLLVQNDSVAFLQEFTDHLSFIVFDNEHLKMTKVINGGERPPSN